jgi:hypothetical protein
MLDAIKQKLGLRPRLYRNPLHHGDIRNEPCVCNSGKKVKSCHGSKYAVSESEMNEIMGHVNEMKKAMLS